MNALTRFGTRAVVRPIPADPTTTGTGYPWQDGDILYADDLNAAFSDSFNTISVLNHGAKGDGSTDDTTAIQAALTTYAGKAVVFIPDTGQSYRIGTILVPSGTDLLIHGTILALPTVGLMFQIANASNVTIRGHGTIDGNHNTGFAGLQVCLNTEAATNVRISGLTIQNSTHFNLAISNSSYVYVDSVRLLNSVNASGFNWSTHSWITRSYMNSGTNDDCWAFYGGCVDCGISDCETTGARVAGISVYADGAGPGGNPTYVPSQNIVIANNISHHNAENGIEVRSGETPHYIHTGIVITGNRCYANSNNFDPQCADIWLSSADGVTVSGNNLSGSGSGASPAWGIWVGNRASHVHIVGNSIWNEGQGGTSGVGIYMQVPSDVLIEGNYFYDNQGTPTMHWAIDGTAGPRCAITGNFFGVLGAGNAPVHMLPASDTVLANSTLGIWVVGNGNGTVGGAIGLNAPVGYNAQLEYRSNSVMRWFVGTLGGSESGGDAGSDYSIVSCTDAGAPKANALSINRASGAVTLNTAPRILAGLNDAPNDAAAASAGVQLGGTYRNGSALMIRIV